MAPLACPCEGHRDPFATGKRCQPLSDGVLKSSIRWHQMPEGSHADREMQQISRSKVVKCTVLCYAR
jgi:hypothetical protein